MEEECVEASPEVLAAIKPPRYFVRGDAGNMHFCETMFEAFDCKKRFGGLVYEPLGSAAADKVYFDESHTELLRACKHALYLLGNDKDRSQIAKEIGDPPWKPRDATSVPETLRGAIANVPLTPEDAQAAYDAAPDVPLPPGRIEEIVRNVTTPFADVIAGSFRAGAASKDEELSSVTRELDEIRAEAELYRRGYELIGAADISEFLSLCEASADRRRLEHDLRIDEERR
jgi:hypothetical protein